jgi:hypothetical protein
MTDQVRVTVIATGFEGKPIRTRVPELTIEEVPEFLQDSFDRDDLEIPAFLRRRT